MTEDFGMRVSVLASSSSGNATYIETPQHHILIDAGFSGKKLQALMQSVGRDLKDVDSLFLTHEHTDHSKGVGVLTRRYPNITLYANQLTLEALPQTIGKLPADQVQVIEPGQTMSLGDLDVEAFAVSHDAAQAQFYQVHHDDKAFAILTDTGYVSDRVAGTIRDADAYVMECNHDLEMLRMGPYPWPLKQRILSDTGHLSNEDGANAIMDVIGTRTKRVYLGHLSPYNNVKALAHITVANMLKAQGLPVGRDFDIYDTDPAIADAMFTV